MNWIVLIGVVMALLGIVGLLFCVRQARRMRDEQPEGVESENRIKHLMMLNMASVSVGFLGLGVVVVGLLLFS